MKTRRGCWLATLALFAVLLASGSTVWGQLPSPQELKQQFQETDQNGDGKVDREEFHRRSVELFYYFDRDRKGYLVLVDIKTLTPEDFKAADRNGDGKLSLEEFLNARFRHFDLADTNQDGGLTIEELDVYVKRLR